MHGHSRKIATTARAAVAIALALSLGGCGLFMRGVPERWEPADGEPACWESPVALVGDAGATVYMGAMGVAVAQLSTGGQFEDDERADVRKAAAGVFAIALVFAVATVRGALVIADCRGADRELARWKLRTCFRYTRDGKRFVACAPTLAACLEARSRALADSGRSLVSACDSA